MRSIDRSNRWRGVPVRYGISTCRLGEVLVAATGKGICAVIFGDSPQQLVAGLRAQLPGADLREDSAGLASRMAAVATAAESPHYTLPLPLDLRGTPFQERVWQALREIPAGTTMTYSDLARRLGIPSAVRAVARACAANSVALAVPCHRVVRKGGDLGGYRWGIERKKTLLRDEQTPAR